MDLGRYINNLNTVLSDQQQKKTFICSLSFGYVFQKWSTFGVFFISSHFFSLISSFQADLFGSWGGGGGAFAPIAHSPPPTRQLNIVGIMLADVDFRMFKRSQHVGQCCFFGNTEGSLDLIFTPNSLRNYNVVTFVRHYAWRTMNTDDG